MKYGETDFFRYLPLNKLFFRGAHRTLVELQARREYEGFGAFPSFVGWEYERYLRELEGAPNLAGAWVWCQTGGWSSFRRRTFLDGPPSWNEINTAVTARMVRTGESADVALTGYVRAAMPQTPSAPLLELLRLSDEVIREGLYIDEFARRKLFFRRLRIPPLLHVYWDQIIISHAMRKLMRCFVQDGEQKIAQGYAALQTIRRMQKLAAEAGLPAEGLQFQYDTFRVLAAAREYLFGPYSAELAAWLRALRRAYVARYRCRFDVHLDFRAVALPRGYLRVLLAIVLRQQRGYRLVDRLLVTHAIKAAGALMSGRGGRFVPRFAHERAMGAAAVLR
jgi:hypothetical protein